MTVSVAQARACDEDAGAPPTDGMNWDQLDWAQINEEVTRLQARIAKAKTRSVRGLLEGLSRVLGNSHARFSGEGTPETACPYPTCKARIRYEFGVKVSLAVTHKQGWMVGAKRFVGNPYDGHTLAAQISQSNDLIKGTGSEVNQAFVDLGYRGVDADSPGVEVIHRGRIKWPEASHSMSAHQKRQLKRRPAIEPAMGHVKYDNRMIGCHLKGSIGDALHAMSCAAGYNIRWLMRAILRLGLRGLFAFVFLALWFIDTRRSASATMGAATDTQSASKIRTRYALI